MSKDYPDYRPIYIIMPDFGGAWAWLKNDGGINKVGVGGNIAMGGTGGWPKSVSIPDDLETAFVCWQAEFEKCNRFGKTKPGFSWENFHTHGIALCQKLKAVLGDDVRVCYESPAEEGTQKHMRQEILQDGTIKIWMLS